MAKVDDNVFPKIIEAMNTSDPAAPTDATWKVYAKAGGIYARSSNSVVGPFAAAGASGAPSTAQYIVGALDGTLSAEKVRTDIYKNYHPDNLPTSGLNAVSNEFDGTSGGTYTWVTSPTASDENTTYPGYLYIEQANALSPNSYRASYAPGAVAFSVAAKVSAGYPWATAQTCQMGISLLDSGDTAIWSNLILDDTSNNPVFYRYNDTSLGSVSTSIPFGQPVYLLIQRTAGNVYTGFFSIDGLNWIQGGSSTVATAVAKVAIRFNTGGTTKKYGTVDFIRVFDTPVTRKIGA